MSCFILLYDQSTILTSGFGLMFKKEKKSLCSLMRKLTSANPHEASPVTSTNAPNHNLYMCFTDTPRSLPHDRLIAIPGGYFFFPLSFLGLYYL